VTGDDVGGEGGDQRDPLLVRPFVLRDPGAPDAEANAADDSAQTWPAATTREAGSPRAMDGADDATAVLHLPATKATKAGKRAKTAKRAGAAPLRGRRRLVVVAVAAAAVLLGAAAAGFAALRSDVRPSVSTALEDGPLPPASGPAATSTSASISAATATSAGDRGSGVNAGPGAPKRTTSPTPGQTTTAQSGAPAIASSPASTPLTTAPGDKPSTPDPPAAIAPAPPATARTGTIRGQNGLCLDLNGGVVFDGNHIQVYDCNGTGAQAWTLATDGTLRVLGKCALLVGDDSIEIVSCDGRTTAQWKISGQLLVNASSNGCLTDPSGGRQSGTGVKVEDCSGSASQRWSLP
jgi:hypothetical protein